MKTLIVNLEECADRREALSRRLSGLNALEIDWLKAVDGRKFSREEQEEKFDISRFRRINRRNPRPGEIGCTLSHQKAYRIAARSEKPLLILEDDVYPIGDVDSALPEIEKILTASRPTIIMLGCAALYRPLSSRQLDRRFGNNARIAEELGINANPYRYCFGTYAYALNPSAAKLLITERPFFTADSFLLFRKEQGVEITVMTRPLFKPADEQEAPSMIASAGSASEPMKRADKLHFFLRNKTNEALERLGILKRLDSIEFRPT